MKLSKFKREFNLTNEIYELSAQFSVDIKGSVGRNIKIKIWKRCDGNFEPDISHFVQIEGQPGPHRPIFQHRPSIEDALKEAINHGLIQYEPENEKIFWVPNDNF